MRTCIFLTIAVVMCCFADRASAAIDPDTIPTFRIRARVISVQQQPPGERQFSFTVRGESATMVGDAWSEWIAFDGEDAAVTSRTYPNDYARFWPLVVKTSLAGVIDPTQVAVELVFDENDATVRMSANLWAGSLGVLIWRDDDKMPGAATMAEYNRRFFWPHLRTVEIAPEDQPKRFPIIDRFIPGDADKDALREGIHELSKGGFSALMLNPTERMREHLLETGNRRTAWAVYNPPGYAFAFGGNGDPQVIEDWAHKQADPFLNVGYEPTDMAAYAMSDEPGWYFPAMYRALESDEPGMQRFHEYLAAQGLEPADLGAVNWDDVKPLGRSKAVDLPSKRLFYWTMRFFSWDSSRHFAVCTRALEEVFYPGMPIFTNWNFFSGRLYVPGPVANNGAKDSPDAAMGGHDWLEFGRMRGGTMLWTEDWFGDEQAWQWSFYCAKLRSAAALGDVEFGGYVIPRTAGSRDDGIVQKIITIAGSGGKAIKYFVFGPEYNFPSNCYSFKSHLLPKMAEAHAMIGRAEDLLMPGRPVPARVAILMPRSAQMWDAKDIEIPNQIYDATNTRPWTRTVDYMAEVFGLYTALQHVNIPTDFFDEDDLTSVEALSRYDVLYVTAPNVPTESLDALRRWLHDGGVLVTVAGAMQADRYDEPSDLFTQLTGITEAPRERLLVNNVMSLEKVADAATQAGTFDAFAVVSDVTAHRGETLYAFDEQRPAVVATRIGAGRAVHFAFMPGMSYFRTGTFAQGRLPEGFSRVLRNLIAMPVWQTGVRPPVMVDRPFVETPLLLSDAGAVVTLLNWTNDPIDAVRVTIDVPFEVGAVTSLKQGPVESRMTDRGLSVTLPLGAVDMLLLHPAD